MTASLHPSDAILTDYASGALRTAFAAVTAAHLESCAHCRSRVETLEAAGLALIETLPPTATTPDLLERTMAALDGPPPAAAPPPRGTVERIPFGRELWLAPGMGIRKARLNVGDDLLYLLRLPAGQRTLPHGHRGVEFTTVLKGAYVDDGQTLSAGDFCEMDPAIAHQPQVTAGGECICLIASEKPMRMATRLGRMVQALVGV